MGRSKPGVMAAHQVERATRPAWTDWRLKERLLQKDETESPSDAINIRGERDKCRGVWL